MYQIFNYKKKRIRTQYIILCHAVDLIKEGIYIDPIVRQGTYKYTWGIWQEYFLRNINKYALPCHYFVELLDKDYVVYNGLADFKQSYFIEELVKYGVIEYNYKDSILVLIGENFNIEPPEQRMFDQMNDKLISKLVKEYNIDFDHVKLLDECLSIGYEEILKINKLGWNITPIKYFDKIEYKMSFNKYCKF